MCPCGALYCLRPCDCVSNQFYSNGALPSIEHAYDAKHGPTEVDENHLLREEAQNGVGTPCCLGWSIDVNVLIPNSTE
jgi:hypothetical protein